MSVSSRAYRMLCEAYDNVLHRMRYQEAVKNSVRAILHRGVLPPVHIVEPLEQRMMLSATAWNGGDGLWSDDGNWSSGVPGSGYDAAIDGGSFAVTVDTNASADNLEVSGDVALDLGGSYDPSTLTVNDDLTIGDGARVYQGDRLTVHGGIAVNSTGTLLTTAPLTVDGGMDVGGGGDFEVSSGTTTLGGPLTVATNGAARFWGGDFYGNVENWGSVSQTTEVHGTITNYGSYQTDSGAHFTDGDDSIYNQAGGSLSLQAIWFNAVNLTNAASGSDVGTVTLGTGGYTIGHVGNGTSTTSGGIVTLGDGYGDNPNLSAATTDNYGSGEIDIYGGDIDLGEVRNTGTINIYGGNVQWDSWSGNAPNDYRSDILTLSSASYPANENQGTVTITVNRANPSAGSVSVDYATSNGTATAGSDYTATSGTLTFATGQNSKTFTIPITNDALVENNETVNLTLSDPTYGAALGNPSSGLLTIVSDDTAGFTVTPTSGLTTTEAGGTATFTVKLTSQPTANVAVGLTSSDTTEGTVGPASLTFTPSTWNNAQTVTVTGVNDFLDDGNINYSIITAAATSTDPHYSGLIVPDVSVTNTDIPSLAGTLTTPTVTEGQSFSNLPIFHFTDANPAGTLSNYTAVVTLGDGTSVTLTSTSGAHGQIVAHTGGGFDVQLSYTYADNLSNATFGVQVTAGRGAGTSASINNFSVANVAPTLTISGAATVNEGASYTLNLTATDPGADTIGQWTIHWGDGTSSIGTRPGSGTNWGNGITLIDATHWQAAHTYADESSTAYTISATATDEDGTYGPVQMGAGTALDTSFGSGGKVITDISGTRDLAGSVAIQADGKVVVAGLVFINDQSDFALLRYNVDGSLDSTFGTNGVVTTDFGGDNDNGYSLIIQPDGKLVVAGSARSIGQDFTFAIARYNSDGTLDSSFGTGGKVKTDFPLNGDWASEVAIQPDGKLVVVGSVVITAGTCDFAMARYNTNGSLDTAFGTSGMVTLDFAGFWDEASSIAIQSDGKIVVAGNANVSQDVNKFGVALFDANGTLDSTFGTGGKLITDFDGGNDGAADIGIQSDGKIVVVGNAGNDHDFAIARYNTNGGLDSTFGTGGKVTTDFGNGSDSASSILIQSDGKLLVAGTSTPPSQDSKFALARYNQDGTLDSSFGTAGTLTTGFPGWDAQAFGLAAQPDGTLVVAGQVSGFPRWSYESWLDTNIALARYTSGGGVTVLEVPVNITGGLVINGVAETAVTSQTVATFTDPPGAEALSEYSATILWGDHTPSSTGTITFDAGSGVFTISGSHAYASSGHYIISIVALHGGLGSITTSLATVAAVNHAPYFTSNPYAGPQGNAYVVHDTAAGEHVAAQTYLQIARPATGSSHLQYALAGTDPDGNPITFSIVAAPAGMQIQVVNGFPTLTWTIVSTTPALGSYQARLRVTDNSGAPNAFDPAEDQYVTVNVVPPGPNEPPYFTSTAIVKAYAGRVYSYPATASDPNSDNPLTFTGAATYINALNQAVTIPATDFVVATDGTVTWTPPAALIDKAVSVNLVVDDGHGGTAEQPYSIYVSEDPLNHPPFIVSTPVTGAVAGLLYQYQVRALDPDIGDVLQYSIIPSLDGTTPAAMSINSSSGLITWTPTAGPGSPDVGAHSVMIRVDDDHGGFDTQPFSVTVAALPATIFGTKFNDLNDNGSRDVVVPPDPTLHTVSMSQVTVANLVDDLGDHQPIVSIGYSEAFNSIIVAYTGYILTDPANNTYELGTLFASVGPDGQATRLFSLSNDGFADSTHFGSVRSGNTAGFVPGDLFVPDIDPYTNSSRSIIRITNRGLTVNRPWASLPTTATGNIYNIYVDESGVFGDKLLALTSSGQIWAYDSTGHCGASPICQINLGIFDGSFISVPNDPRYGPAAGKLLVTNDGADIYSVDSSGTVVDLGITGGEDLSFIPDSDNMFAIKDGDPHIYAAGGNQLAPAVGDIILADEHSRGLLRVYWDGTTWNEAQIVDDPAQWEETAFLPAGLGPIPESREPGLKNWTIYLDLNHDGQFDDNEPFRLTDAAGNYEFDSLPPGTYTVGEVPQAGWIQTTPTSYTYTVNLVEGQVIGGLDFGNTKPATPPANHPPHFTSIPSTSIVLGQTYTYHATASDVDRDTLAFALSAGPDGMTIDQGTGLLSWMPLNTDLGKHQTIVTVSDGRDGSIEQVFAIDVVSPNDPPAFTSQPTGPAAPGVLWTYQAAASDKNGDSLTFVGGLKYRNASGQLVNVSISTSGLLTWTPPADAGLLGTSVPVRVVVSDGRGGFDKQNFWLPVEANAAPTLDFGNADPLVVGRAWSIALIGADPDGLASALTYTVDADSSAKGMKVEQDSGTGIWHLIWMPLQTGDYSATVTVTDSGTPVASTSRMITLPVNPAPSTNVPPDITSTPTGPAVRNRQWSYLVKAEDLDGDALDFALSQHPSGATWSVGTAPNTWLVTWTPSVGGTRHFQITVSEHNNSPHAVTQDFDLPVADNAPPVILQAPNQVGAPTNAVKTIAVNFIDPNGDDVTADLIDSATGQVLYTTGSIDPVSSDPSAPSTASLEYTPLVEGTRDLTIRLTDSQGASVTDTFTLAAYSAGTNEPPSFTFQAPLTTAIGHTFTGKITSITDREGDSIYYDLVFNSGNAPVPQGMSIDHSTGEVTWTPTAAQLTSPTGSPYQYKVTAYDGHNTAVATNWINLTVVSQITNQPPSITSTPTGDAIAGIRYIYDAKATDPNIGDPITWVLMDGPTGAVIDPDTGHFTWTPTQADVATSPAHFVIRAYDAHGAFAEQSADLPINSINTPPLITSQPPTKGSTTDHYIYVVQAFDQDRDHIAFTITVKNADTNTVINPSTYSFDPVDATSARFDWLPPSGDASYAITIIANDGRGGAYQQSFTLGVSAAVVDTPPVFTSTPVMAVLGGQTYQYAAEAFDPNGSVAYSLVALKSDNATHVTSLEGAINATSGVINWAATDSALYGQTLHLTVVATQNGISAQQPFDLFVSDPATNQVPTIDAAANLSVGLTGLFRMTVVGHDPENHPLTYELIADPANNIAIPSGMTIDNQGRVVWPSASPVGATSFKVQVTDVGGATATRVFSVAVNTDAPPTVSIVPSDYSPAAGSVLTVMAVASDDLGISDISIKVTGYGIPTAGINLPVNGDGTANFQIPMGTEGQQFTFTAVATDTGNHHTTSAPLPLTVAAAPDTSAPFIDIATPYNGSTISAPTPLMGKLFDPENHLIYYSVTATPVDGGAAIPIVTKGVLNGSTIIPGIGDASTSAQITILDASLLTNGTYSLTITATDATGKTSTLSGQTFTVESNSKLGNFSVGFTDLTVPVSGVLVTVHRIYDTLNAPTSGDFGYGWKLDLFTVKLDVDIDAGRDAVQNLGFEDVLGIRPGWRYNSRITLVLPDGSRASFTAVPDAIALIDTGDLESSKIAQAILTDFAGFRSIALVPDSSTNGVTLSLTGQDPEGLHLNEYDQFCDSSNIPYNPFDYGRELVLTTKDGTQYQVDADGTLKNITASNGNQVTIDATGVTAYSPSGQVMAQLGITRDPSHDNRITQIHDPDGKVIVYHYGATTGDLIGVTDRVQSAIDPAVATTTYAYGENLPPDLQDVPHILTSITNAAGVKVMAIGYETDGRVNQIQDASGHAAGLSYSVDGPTVGLPAGSTIEVATDALSKITEIARDGHGNMIRKMQQIDATVGSWLVTAYTYNAQDLQTGESRPFTALGNLRYTTNPNPNDPSQWVSQSTYDPSGNLLTSTGSTGKGTAYSDFDRFGNPRQISDSAGNKTTNTYDNTTGNLLSTKDAAGNTTNYGYSNGNLTSIVQTTAEGTVLTLSSMIYDGAGHLLDSTDANGVTHYFRYDNAGNQVLSYLVWTDPANGSDIKTIVSRTDYDVEGRATGTRQYALPGTRTLNSTVDLTTADEAYVTSSTTTHYNALGQVDYTLDTFGARSETLYDASSKTIQTRTQVRDAGGTLRWQVTRTAYDDNGRAVATTDPFLTDLSGNILTGQDFRITYTHLDPLGRAVGTDRIQGHMITQAADTVHSGFFITSFDRASITTGVLSTTQTVYRDDGQINYAISATGQRTTYNYDSIGRQTGTTQDLDLNRNGTISSNEHLTTSQTFDSVGRVDSTTDANGHTTIFGYDTLGRQYKTTFDDGSSTQIIFDALGRKIASIDQLGRRTDYAYDEQGRLIAVTLPAISTTDARKPRYEYGYDAYGNQSYVVTDAYLSADGTTVVYQHKDANGDDVNDGSRTLSQTPLVLGEVTRYTYDYAGRQTSRTLPLGQEETFTYDALGRPSLHVSFEGTVTAYAYDDAVGTGGRLASKNLYASTSAYNNGLGTPDETVTYGYDAFNRMTATTDSLTGTCGYHYDTEGRQIQVAGPVGTINYQYDPTTGQLMRTWTGTNAAAPITDTRYDYDAVGRLADVIIVTRNGSAVTGDTVTWEGQSVTGEVTSYYYDAVGDLKDVVESNNVVAAYTYDDLNRLTDVVDFVDANTNLIFDGGDTLKASFHYVLNADGTKHSETDTDDLSQIATFTWTYDGLNRMASETYSSYDASANFITAYRYDLVGNRLLKTTEHAASSSDIATFQTSGTFTADETDTYTYDSNDRLVTEQDDAAGTTNDTFTVYQYGPSNGFTMQKDKTVYAGLDNSGTVTTQTHFDYDDQGRLAQATITQGGTTISVTAYAYDDAGIRISQTITAGGTTTTTTYLIDANNPTGYQQVLEEYVNSVLSKTYTLGADVIAQHDNTNGTLTLLYDGHGSTRALLDHLAQVIQRFAFDAYGNQLTATGLTSAASALTNFLYSGEQYDKNLGLQYLRARYYNPGTGTFISLDSFTGSNTDPQSLHKYLYAHSNPTNGIDPSGHWTLSELLVSLTIATVFIHVLAPPVLNAWAQANGGSLWDSPYIPDAAIIGIEGSSTTVLSVLGGAAATCPVLWRWLQMPGFLLYQSGVASANIGVEILFSIASGQMEAFFYAGLGGMASGSSAMIYTGIVFDLWNADEYAGSFYTFGGSGTTWGGGSFISGQRLFSPTSNKGPYGTILGRSWGVASQMATWTYYWAISPTLTNHADMSDTIFDAATWGATSAALISNFDPYAMWGSAIGTSYWPYAKWKTPSAMQYRQTHVRP